MSPSAESALPHPPPSGLLDIRLALAMALVKARSSHYASFQHWKRKAKSRKKELQSLRKILQQQQCDSAVSGILPQPGLSCKCSFFENSKTTTGESTVMDMQEKDIDQLLFRQFLRMVHRWNYAKDSQKCVWATGALDLDKKYQLSVTCKFLADLVRKSSPDAGDGGYVAAYAHQGVEVFQGTLRDILKDPRGDKMAAEGITTELASQLLEIMLTYSCNSSTALELTVIQVDARSWIFQLLIKLGLLSFVGQRVLIIATDHFASVAERLCFVDPFENNLCQLFDNVMFVLQLIENLILYHSSCWKNDDSFDERLLEEWVNVFVKARKISAVLAKQNSLLLAYMERITGQMVKQLHRLSDIHGKQGRHTKDAFLKFVLPEKV